MVDMPPEKGADEICGKNDDAEPEPRYRRLILLVGYIVAYVALVELASEFGYRQTESALKSISVDNETVFTLHAIRNTCLQGVWFQNVAVDKHKRKFATIWWPGLVYRREVKFRLTASPEEPVVLGFYGAVPEFYRADLRPNSITDHPFLYPQLDELLDRDDVRCELNLSLEAAARAKEIDPFRVVEVLKDWQFRRLCQISLQFADPRWVFAHGLPYPFQETLKLFPGEYSLPTYDIKKHSSDEWRVKFQDVAEVMKKRLTEKQQQQFHECLGRPFGATWYSGMKQ